MIDINNQQDYLDYFNFYTSKMKEETTGFSWVRVAQLLLPLAVFAGAMFWLGSTLA